MVQCTDIAFPLLCFALGLTQSGLPCHDICEIKHSGQCEIPETMGTVVLPFARKNPCAICNVTEQAQKNLLVNECNFPRNLAMLQVAGHNRKNGTLEKLPKCLSKLHTLVLGPGNIRTVRGGVFSGDFKSLRTLTMNNNAIQTVGSWFGLIWRLEKLYLSWNEIKEIEKDALQPLECLEHLDLTHNRLRVVEKWHFAGLTQLKCLKLSHNNISHIAGNAFDRLSMLDKIYLDHNRLARLEDAWLKCIPLSINVHLQHNLIQTISAESFGAMRKRQVRLFVNENPFRCTCALDSWKAKGAKAVQDYESLQCSYPPSLLGRKIADVAREMNKQNSIKQMPCPPPTVLVKVTRQDNRAALVCEVFWEQQKPEIIRWLDPEGRDVRSLDPCFNSVNKSLVHEILTNQSPETTCALSANSSGLPYVGRSTYTLYMSPQGLHCEHWGEGSFQCIVKSATDTLVSADLSLTKASGSSRGKTRNNCGDGTNMEPTKADSQITSGASSSKAPPVTSQGGTTEVTTKISKKIPQQDSTTPEAADIWHNVFKTAVNPITLGPRNSTIIERTNKTTNNSLQTVTTPGTDNLPYHTATNTTTPSRRQETVFTEKIIFLNTLEKIPGQQQDGMAMLTYITATCLALLLLGGAMAACHKGYRRRQERHRVPGNAANASGGTQLQNSQQTTMGNPATPQPAYEQVPDISNADLDVSPYATTVEMANPMYNITPTEPKGVRSIQDPPPLPNRQTINNPSSQPQGMEMPHTGDIPALPPRTHRHINYNPSTQPQGMEAENIPASPPPNTNRHSNYNASASPQSSDTTQMGKIQDLPPRSNMEIPYGASTSQQSSEIPPVHEIPDPTPRSKRHINSSSGSSQPQGLQVPSGEEAPDLPP